MNHTPIADEIANQARDYLQQLGLHDANRLNELSLHLSQQVGPLTAVRKTVGRWVEKTCYLKLPEHEAGLALAEAAILLSAIAERDPQRFLSFSERPKRALVDDLRLCLPVAVPEQRATAMPTQSLQPVSAPEWLRKPLPIPKTAVTEN